MKKLLISGLILCSASYVVADSTLQDQKSTTNNVNSNVMHAKHIGWSRQPRVNFLAGDLEGKPRSVSVIIQADKFGKIIEAKIDQSSGLSELDNRILSAVKVAKLRPTSLDSDQEFIKVIQDFKFISHDYSSTKKSPPLSNRVRKPICSYSFNSVVLNKQIKGQETAFKYIQKPPLSIQKAELERQDRMVKFEFKLSRKNKISDIKLIQGSNLVNIDSKVIDAVSKAQVSATRKFYQFYKLKFEDQIDFNLNACD
ncbi:energy transducer TonB [Acinetobacter shaoyimingii]|uniref:TonB C-terminal domain-containing protein n=1 Tax=Acinetobacter shaoyimingii TaxID=2715164 RepID=A0A6G8RT58_9GAMM|nr:TonB C-terminal domain-containing protein [Acinetobacter shaoyimingii]QIO05057.1 hypothetical protein G8E00_03255 [Acinetobacter shaoyimingii]